MTHVNQVEVEIDAVDMQELLCMARNTDESTFLYLSFAWPKSSHCFSPYKFKIVPYENVDKNSDYLIVSCRGVTYFSHNKEPEFTYLNDWENDYSTYIKLRKVRFFAKFQQWRIFCIWKKCVAQRKFETKYNLISHNLLIVNNILGPALHSCLAVCSQLEDMSIGSSDNMLNTLSLEKFTNLQISPLETIERCLLDFREMLKDVLQQACHSMFSKEGFTVSRPSSAKSDDLNSKIFKGNTSNLSYVDQETKRNLCKRLYSFLRYADCLVCNALHKILINSVENMLMLIKNRMKNQDEGTILKPLCYIELCIEENQLVLQPSEEDVENCFQFIIGAWERCILSFQSFVTDNTLRIYTQDTKPEESALETIIAGDTYLKKKQTEMLAVLQSNFVIVNKFITQYTSIAKCYVTNKNTQVEAINNETDLNIFRVMLLNFVDQKAAISKVPSSQSFGMFLLQMENFLQTVLPPLQELIQTVYKVLPKVGRNKIRGMSAEVQEAQAFLELLPKTTANYVEYLRFIDKTANRLPVMFEDMVYVQNLHVLMQEYGVPCLKEDLNAFKAFQSGLSSLKVTVEKKMCERESIVSQFEKEMCRDVTQLLAEISAVQSVVNEASLLDVESDVEEVQLALHQLRTRLDECQCKADYFREQQIYYQLNIQECSTMLTEAQESVHLRQLLWDNLELWESKLEDWDSQIFHTLDPEEINHSVQHNYNIIKELETGLPPNQLPVIRYLRNPTLEPRHWQCIGQLVDRDLSKEEALTLRLFEDMDIFKHENRLQEISNQATCEANLDKSMNNVENQWNQLSFSLSEHGLTCILGDLSDVYNVVDDTNVALSAIASSIFAEPIMSRVEIWRKTLKLFSLTMEEWTRCQQGWLLLESFFNVAYIKRKLPIESSMFSVVTKSWILIMESVKKNTHALNTATRKNLLDEFKKNNQTIKQILRQLEPYLETRRILFPRFYFLTDKELLDVITKSNPMDIIQKYATKCFMGVARFIFKQIEDKNWVTALISSHENEELILERNINVKGQIEDWLANLNVSIEETIKHLIKFGSANVKKFNIIDITLQYPQQIALTLLHLQWCKDVESALNRGSDLKQVYNKYSVELQNMVEQVRDEGTDAAIRDKMASVIIYIIHFQDVVKNLTDKNICKIESFEWQRRLRVHWNEMRGHCEIRMGSATLLYGYEYVGVNPRLVYTASTERSFFSLLTALHILNIGGLVASSSGCGKTETLLTLAHIVAIHCIIIPCSDNITHKILCQVLSGAAQVGAWCCFVHADLLPSALLSAVTHQIEAIHTAKRHRYRRFIYCDREIKLKENCGIFMTTGPLRDTNIPENIKTQFRPISLAYPNEEIIAEALLTAQGFTSSSSLATKLAQIFMLCREQLSYNMSFCFDTRNLKQVINNLGFCRNLEDSNEHELLFNALYFKIMKNLLPEEIILFQAILREYFGELTPNDLPVRDDEELIECIKQSTFNLGLHPDQRLINNMRRLRELKKQSHAIILYGNAGIGKTSVWKLLQSVLSHKRKTVSYVIYPMSHSYVELFGGMDIKTLEWTDGLVSSLINIASQQPQNDFFFVFDGPLNEHWIKGLGTLENKNGIVCFGNLEQLKLYPNVTIIFETLNLKDVTPSVISRCSLFHITDTENKTWVSFVKNWLNKLKISEDAKIVLENLFISKFPSGLKFIEENMNKQFTQDTVAIASTLCTLIQSQIQPEDNAIVTLDNENSIQTFVFSYLSAFFGPAISCEYREKIDKFISNLFVNELKTQEFPEGILNYYWKNMDNCWKQWPSLQQEAYDHNLQLPEMTVTEEMIKIKHITDLLIQNQHPFMITGVAGCGKTTIARYLLNNLRGSVLSTALSLLTHPNTVHLQQALLCQLEKRGRDVMAAPRGKHVLLHMDDVHVTCLNSVLDMIRQLLDHGALYAHNTTNELNWLNIEDVLISMIYNDSRNNLNSENLRLFRHFTQIRISEPSLDTLKSIYEPALKQYLLGTDLSDLSKSIMNVYLMLYERVRKKFLPMPCSSFYMFTQTSLERCVRGLTHADVSLISSAGYLIKLAHNEFIREFRDRLISVEDIQDCNLMIREEFEKVFTEQMTNEDIILNDNIIFADFMTAKRNYVAIENIDTLVTVLQDHLEVYNEMEGNVKLPLVIFPEFAEHIARIGHGLRKGHVLLLAPTGCGRRSITQLATYLHSYEFIKYSFLPETCHEEFQQFLLDVCLSTVKKKQDTVFFVLANKSMNDECLEDLHCLIKLGNMSFFNEINYYNKIITTMRLIANLEETDNESMFIYFINKLKRKLHVVICWEIDDNNHSKQLRKWPSLVTNSTLNWIPEWPQQALESLAKLSKRIDIDDSLKNKLTKLASKIHLGTMKLAEDCSINNNKQIKITLHSYDEMLQLYQYLYKNELIRLLRMRDKCLNGLKKLHETLEAAEEMKQELASLEPALRLKNESTEALLQSLLKEQAQVEKIRQIVAADEMLVKAKSDEAQTITTEAQKDIEEALPAIETAVKALDTVERNDLKDIRAMTKPPTLVKFVMEAVCLLMGNKTDWGSIKALTADTTFIKRAMELDRDNIPDLTLRKLKEYVEHPNFVPEVMETQSRACRSFCMWVRAVDAYAKTYRTVLPKKKRLEAAEDELASAISELRSKQQILADVEGQVARLESQYDTSVAEQSALQAAVELTTSRLARAGHITPTINDENERWTTALQQYSEQLQNLPGDLMLSAACMTYIGSFSKEYRAKLNHTWRSYFEELEIPISNYTRFIEIFTNPFMIHTWHVNGLPKDNFAIENAIITLHADKWPLLIDPQELGVRWIRQMESSHGLIITSLIHSNYMQRIEQAMQGNKPIILQEVSEHLPYKLCKLLLETAVYKRDNDESSNNLFKIYLTTRLNNPKFHPDVYTCVTIIDFSITAYTLEEKLLSDIIRLEAPELEQQLNSIQARSRSDRREHNALEQNILDTICNYKYDILDDEALINSLNKDKVASDSYVVSLDKQTALLANVQTKREMYKPVAERASTMFFVILQLMKLNPMYQYSLQNYIQMIQKAIKDTPKVENQSEFHKRTQQLVDVITHASLQALAPCLEECHRELHQIFACMTVMQRDCRISPAEWTVFLEDQPQINQSLIEQHINKLQTTFECFTNLKFHLKHGIKLKIGNFREDISFVREKYIANEDDLNRKLTDFQKLILIKYFKREKLISAINEFVKINLGNFEINKKLFTVKSVMRSMRKVTPLILILGAEPLEEIRTAVHKKGALEDFLYHIALSSGQEIKALELISKAASTGKWVYLQNCHDSPKWIIELLKLLQHIWEEPSSVNDSFRIFIGTKPLISFPPLLLHNSLKLNTSLTRDSSVKFPVYLVESTSIYSEEHGEVWTQLVQRLCRFDCVVRERGSYESSGWNATNQFGYNNLDNTLRVAHKLFTEIDNMPWEEIIYYTEQMYTTCVAYKWDWDCLSKLMKFHVFPIHNTEGSVKIYSNEVSAVATTVYNETGLCATIVANSQNKKLLNMLQICENTFTLKNIYPNDSLRDMINEIKLNIPKCIWEPSHTKFVYKETSETYNKLALLNNLHLELKCYNKLLHVIHISLDMLSAVYCGQEKTSDSLLQLEQQLMSNEVPSLWKKYSFPTLLSLNEWISTMKYNIAFIEKWKTNVETQIYHLPAFFFPVSFLYSIFKIYAIENNICTLNNLKFSCKVLTNEEETRLQHVAKSDSTGVIYVSGLFLDCASWDFKNMSLVTQKSEMNNCLLNLVQFEPIIYDNNDKYYETPIFRTNDRTKFVTTVFWPMQEPNDKYWMLRASAILLENCMK